MNSLTDIYNVKRVFKEQKEQVLECYERYRRLHYNPVSAQRVEEIFSQGQIWAAYKDGQMTACCYFLPADAPVFKATNAYWEISDLTDSDLRDYMVAGCVGFLPDCQSRQIYTAFMKLGNILADRGHKNKLVHYVPAHMSFPMQALFDEGFYLTGLRGLDNIVPNYIFEKQVWAQKFPAENEKSVKRCSVSDTKGISKLCEHKYTGVDLEKDNTIIFSCRR